MSKDTEQRIERILQEHHRKMGSKLSFEEYKESGTFLLRYKQLEQMMKELSRQMVQKMANEIRKDLYLSLGDLELIGIQSIADDIIKELD